MVTDELWLKPVARIELSKASLSLQVSCYLTHTNSSPRDRPLKEEFLTCITFILPQASKRLRDHIDLGLIVRQ